jgi:hypothetical protein
MKPLRIYALVAVIAFAAGWLVKPAQVRVETKTVEISKNIKGLKETITVVQRKDGTTETVTNRSVDSISEKSKSKSVSSTGQPNWAVGAYSTVWQTTPEYSITVQRRILGNLSVGGMIQSDLKRAPTASIGLQCQF